MSLSYLLLIALMALSLDCAQGDSIEDSWVEPNAWAREHQHQSGVEDLLFIPEGSGATAAVGSAKQTETNPSNKCTSGGSPSGEALNDNALALMYFKKFINTLFNRNKLKYIETLNAYQRALLFNIPLEQLDRLEQLTDPRDLDVILTEILRNVKSPYEDRKCNHEKSRSTGLSGIGGLIWDILKDVGQLLKISEIQFSLAFVGIILLGSFVNRRYRIGLISMVIGGFFLFGYFTAYLECNRELENKKMIEVLSMQQKGKEPRWYTAIWNFFGGSSDVADETSLQEQLRKSSRLNLDFCRPDHVLLAYFNDIFFKQIELVLSKSFSVILTVRDTMSFPYNYFAAFTLIMMLAYMLKLTFKYILSPKAWASLLHRPQVFSNKSNAMHAAVSAPSSEDRLTGENLKMLLNVLHKSTTAKVLDPDDMVGQQLASLPAIGSSRVEDITSEKDLTVGIGVNSSSDGGTSTPNSSKSSSPNTSQATVEMSPSKRDSEVPNANNNNPWKLNKMVAEEPE